MKYSCMLFGLSAVLFSQGAMAGLYRKSDPIIELTPKNFDEEVLRTNHPVFVEFYAPWCGHCKNLVPIFRKTAENLQGIVKHAAVNCDEESNSPICSRYGIRGFPTLKLFPGVSQAYKRKHVVGRKDPVDYNGERGPNAIVNFLISRLPDNIRKVSKKQTTEKNIHIDDFIADQDNVRALLLTQRDEPSTMYKGLATEYAHRAHVAVITKPDQDIMDKFEVEKLPALVFFKEGSQEAIKYTGELKREPIVEYLNTLLPESEKDSGSSSSSSSSSSESKAKTTVVEPFDPKVHQVKTQEDLERECLNKPTGTCLVSFMVVEEEYPESVEQHTVNLAVLEQVKKAIHDKQGRAVHFLWMDALKENVQKLRNSFQISSDVPGLMLVHPKRKAYVPFVGAYDFEGVMGWLQEAGSQRAHAIAYTHTFELEPEVNKEDQGSKKEQKEEEQHHSSGFKDQSAGSNNLPKDEL